MVMLLGLCLVVSGDFGNRLVFRYPPLPLPAASAAAASTVKPTLGTSAASLSGAAAATPISSSINATPTGGRPGVSPFSSSRASFSPASVSAKAGAAVAVPSAVAESATEDADDDVPPPLPPALLTSASATSTAPSSSAARRSSLSQMASSASTPSSASPLLSAALPGSSHVAAQLPLGDKEDVWGMPVYEFKRLFSPLSSHLSSSLFDVAVNAVRFLSFPIHLPVESRHETTMFNTVLVLKADAALTTREAAFASSSASSSSQTSLLLDLYSTVLIQLSRALEHEQKRCGFLSYHSSHMTQLRDRFIASLQTAPTPPANPNAELCSLLVHHSLLASHLHDLYRQLLRLERLFYAEERGGGGRRRRKRDRGNEPTHVHVLINRWLHLHCTLSPSAVPSPLLSSSSSHLSPLTIRPYQTLLLTTSRESLLSSLPPDSSPLLAEFILQLKPTQSFLALSSSLSLPLSSLLLLAHHLVQWGKARVIDTLQDTDVFTVSPPPPPLTPSVLSSFAAAFPSSSLALFLAAFHPPRPLSSHLSHLSPHAKQVFMRQVVWTLEQGLLVQLHHRLYAVGEEAGRATELEASDDRQRWTDAEWVAHLTRYGDGVQTLTEIEWWERNFIGRNDLLALIQRHPQHFLLVMA